MLAAGVFYSTITLINTVKYSLFSVSIYIEMCLDMLIVVSFSYLYSAPISKQTRYARNYLSLARAGKEGNNPKSLPMYKTQVEPLRLQQGFNFLRK